MEKSNRKLRTKHVATYLTDDDFSQLDSMALDENMSLSSFIRFVLKNYMRKKAATKKS